MSRLALPFLVSALILLPGCQARDEANCAGYCGPGTECVEGRCEIAAEDDEEEVVEEEGDGKKKRKRRRRRKGKGGAAGGEEGEFEEDELPPFVPVDDSRIPKFKGAVDQNLDMKGGSSRLSDAEINKHLRKLERKFQKCIETAALYSDDYVGGGTISYKFRIENTGKVSGVSAKAPAKLSVFGIIPCVRKAIYTHKFPSFEGLSMAVDSSFSVD